MTEADSSAQREVIEFLSRPEPYGADIGKVERIDTHGAIVFLAGTRAYKLKRAVRFPYMDFSTRERRRAMCEAEIAVNRRTAPMIYLGVEKVTREAGRLRLGGSGEALDWVVVMRRFDQADLFDKMAEAGRLNADLIGELARGVAEFHRSAEIRSNYGGQAGMAWVVDGNRTGLLEGVPRVFRSQDVDAFIEGCRRWFETLGPLLEDRRRQGFVRHCHGDLHLRNICLFDGKPVPFDAIEFNDQVACIDTLYDYAFLLMDMARRTLPDLANVAFNAYLEATQDFDGLAALPFFLACRAGVRAQTGAAAARAQPDPRRREALQEEARGSLDFAISLLSPAPARLVAIGGLSGTGKSTLARGLAPFLGRPPGAVVLRSDVIRKRLAGVAATVRLGPEAYSRENSTRVYAAIMAAARKILGSGQAVIADAVFARADEREAVAAVARAANVPFDGIWLEAPESNLVERLESRRHDASDATAAVLRQQLTYDLGPITWHRVTAAGTPDDILGTARALI